MKKVIELFALVAVVSLVGCGAGSGGGEKNEEQSKKNEVVTLEGQYKASRYECQDGSNYLDKLGATGSMTFDVAKEELTVTITSEEVVSTRMKSQHDGFNIVNVVLNASFTDTDLTGKEVKSFTNTDFVPNVPVKEYFTTGQSPLLSSNFSNFSAKYTLKDKNVTFKIDHDDLCGGNSSVITAERITEASDQSKKDEENAKTVAALQGNYFVTSYVCDDTTDVLGSLGMNGTMYISLSGQKLTFSTRTEVTFTSSAPQTAGAPATPPVPGTVHKTYQLKTSITKTTLKVEEVKASSEAWDIPSLQAGTDYKRDRGAAKNEAEFATLSAQYTLIDAELTLTTENDPFCNGQKAVVKAQR